MVIGAGRTENLTRVSYQVGPLFTRSSRPYSYTEHVDEENSWPEERERTLGVVILGGSRWQAKPVEQ